MNIIFLVITALSDVILTLTPLLSTVGKLVWTYLSLPFGFHKMNIIFLVITGFTSVLGYRGNTTLRSCASTEWSCDDGSCIDSKLTCNGAVNCPDKSDEAFEHCWNNKCSGFKCVYGGCVASNATCNGVRDCADGSDEKLHKCRNELTYKECRSQVRFGDPNYKQVGEDCIQQSRTCKNGQVLKNYQKCDGIVDCDDRSDETLENCATDQHDCHTLALGPKFRCKYGACILQAKVCNGVQDCADGSDELPGLCEAKTASDWECEDGTIIDGNLKCNGAVNCPDGSDETFLLCMNNECPFGFRCVYGGCVSNAAVCNGIKDCVDNSDELQMKCRNEETFGDCNINVNKIHYPTPKERNIAFDHCLQLERHCKNGQEVARRNFCDGQVDCDDGSDETLEACSTDRNKCFLSKSFTCQYGGCVDKSKVCNKVKDCVDGSDELDDMCNPGKCVLPEYPEHGNYTVVDEPRAYPGLALKSVLMTYWCEPGYKHNGKSSYVICAKGVWADEPLQCIAQCNLMKDPSIVFRCLKKDALFLSDTEECGDEVPEGTTVIPECREPNYYYPEGVLSFMTCVNRTWDRPVPSCSPRCGLVTPQGDRLIINGTKVGRGVLPWHAGIYYKRSRPYQQMCGGSLITDNIVLTAAHCFWSDLEKLLPASNYAVALGKLYRPWNDKHDTEAQKSDVKEILVPDYFHGTKTSFQDDIALLVLSNRMRYNPYVRPVCLDFDYGFESKQLTVGQSGIVAGWGLTAEDGKASPVLLVAELPYVDINRCFKESPVSFYMYITFDKFCAGNHKESSLCQGDSGGGLVFSTRERNQERYYLRGVVSTKPQSNHRCNANSHTAFTQISKHQAFIQEHLGE